MTNDPIRDFAALLRRSVEAGSLKNVTFHAPASGEALKIRGELRTIGGRTVLQLETSLTEGRVRQENLSPDTPYAIEGAVSDALAVFRRADLTDSGGTATLLTSKKGARTLVRHGSIGTAKAENVHPDTDRAKHRLLTGEEPFLVPLGISDKSGRVHDKMQSKFRQIARFSEYVAEAEKTLSGDGELLVCDLCCGKSYLSFAAYHVLTAVCHRRVKMICVDLKESVMAYCAEVARASGFDGMEFRAMNVRDFSPPCPPDLVISLHACDTATDMVLDFAASNRARLILATPCCQHELNRLLDCPALDFIAERPILRQKFCATATDALRLLKLEAAGYKTDATELIDPEDTPKNVMLRAVLRDRFDPGSPDAKAKAARYEAARALLYGANA